MLGFWIQTSSRHRAGGIHPHVHPQYSKPGDARIHCSPWSVATAPGMAMLSHDPLPG